VPLQVATDPDGSGGRLTSPGVWPPLHQPNFGRSFVDRKRLQRGVYHLAHHIDLAGKPYGQVRLRLWDRVTVWW
jgi:hypothetical protein